jgi:hypothetical protein
MREPQEVERELHGVGGRVRNLLRSALMKTGTGPTVDLDAVSALPRCCRPARS